MIFRRKGKIVRDSYYIFGAIGIFVFLVSFISGESLWLSLLVGLLISVGFSLTWTFIFIFDGYMDIILLDEKGITITLIRLVRKKSTHFTTWDNIASIETIKGYGGQSFYVRMKTSGKYNYHFLDDYLVIGWNVLIEEYFCVNHPEIPFTPIKYGKQ